MATPVRTRREAPPFRRVRVRRVARLSPHMLRVTLAGPELAGLPVGLPTGNVRLLVPGPEADDLVLPVWNGNEFLDADGTRPVIRSYTPRRYDPDKRELDIDVVLHEGGAVSAWAEAASPGDAVAVSGTGRGYAIDPEATHFLLAGDEAALPAIGVLLEQLPESATVRVFAEVAHPDARLELPAHPGVTVTWCDLPAGAAPGEALLAALAGVELADDERIWIAGEAAAVQRARTLFVTERAVPRTHTWIRGYWKVGSTGGAEDEANEADEA